MSWSASRDALKIADVALQACEMIEKLTGLGGAPVEGVLSAIGAIIEHVKQGVAGTMTPEQVSSAFVVMATKLAANDSGADTALDKKFKS